jgi:hypothetical protein
MTARRYIQQESTLHNHLCENLKSYTDKKESFFGPRFEACITRLLIIQLLIYIATRVECVCMHALPYKLFIRSELKWELVDFDVLFHCLC